MARLSEVKNWQSHDWERNGLGIEHGLKCTRCQKVWLPDKPAPDKCPTTETETN